MWKLTIVITCVLLFAGHQLQGATSGKKAKRPPRSKPATTIIDGKEIITANVDEPLAIDMLKVYRSLKTYHAVWEVALPVKQKNLEQKFHIETAFDKKTTSCLYKISSYELQEDKWQPISLGHSPGTILVVYEPNELNVAGDMGYGIETKEVKFDEKKKFTYRDFRKCIMPLLPCDLPMMISDMPFLELLQAGSKGSKETTKKADKPKTRTLEIYPTGGERETAVRLGIDNDKLLINQFSYFKPIDNEVNITMKRVSLTINKPLPADIFDFDKQYASVKIGKDVKKASLPAK
jgi:hypothetical protein